MSKPKIRGRFDRLRREVMLAEHDEDLNTQQQFKDECDVNRIVANAQRGIAPKFMPRGQPFFGDFTDMPDLTQAFSIIQRAEESFMQLPSELRLELGNDPRNLGQLTKEQVIRFNLGKEAIEQFAEDGKGTPPRKPSSSSAGGQPANPEKGSKTGTRKQPDAQRSDVESE